MKVRTRKRLGIALVALGLLVIFVTVIWVLEVANGPGHPTAFAERRSYNQTKVAIHGVFLRALGIALVGLGIAWWGTKQIERAARDAAVTAPRE